MTKQTRRRKQNKNKKQRNALKKIGKRLSRKETEQGNIQVSRSNSQAVYTTLFHCREKRKMAPMQRSVEYICASFQYNRYWQYPLQQSTLQQKLLAFPSTSVRKTFLFAIQTESVLLYFFA